MLTVTICVLSLCVQVHERSTADGLFPEAKLLDFGLSKMVGEDFGSAAICHLRYH
jgi:hypothetical protein